MEINEEKKRILEYEGDTLVIANPGTGKTLLLAHKYARLIGSGISPEDILCLTFTKKAKKEMEGRIIKILKEQGREVDYAHMNIYNFHSYALEAIGREGTIPANLLRYSIYRYFKENDVLNYGDDYLIETIVPKMENLIRYLKSFGVLPQDIDIGKVKPLLSDYKKLSKEEMDRFAEYFVDIYRHYEEVKRGKGIDYADMLLEFTKLQNKPQFRHVLIDELQDVNKIEADIALSSGKTFFAVGDKKQAIFGFQGGSIVNFGKFSGAKTFVLSENFRSANPILDYAKEYLVSKTADAQHKEDLKNLNNPEKKGGGKPILYDVPDENRDGAVCQLAGQLIKKHKRVAVIARTNFQVMALSKELQARGIEHSSTYFASSNSAKMHIINFLRGVLSNDLNDIRNSMFTPFFPISLQDAFELSELKEFTLDKVFGRSPEFRKIREEVKSVEDVNSLFNGRILPVAVAYGKDYMLAALAVSRSFNETLAVLDKVSFSEVLNYLKASDILADESDVEKQVVLTTVHKAKGREFPAVIYVPHELKDRSNFQDEVVKAVLKVAGIDAEEELGEESLRIGFVALTRAEDELHILPSKTEDYLNEFCERRDLKLDGIAGSETTERLKRAYALFVEGNYEKSKALLARKREWVGEFVRKHFDALDSVSFSSLRTGPCEYLKYNLLGVREGSPALSLGSDVHALANAMLKSEKYVSDETLKPYERNISQLMGEIKKEYPGVVGGEKKIVLPLGEFIGAGGAITFKGYIDAVFKNSGGDYLIVDWKTSKDTSGGSGYRQQLEAYRQAYSAANGISPEKIKVAIGYVGLKTTVNLGKVDCQLDDAQPRKSAFETFRKKVGKILEWKKEPKQFFRELEEKCGDDLLCRAVVEEYSSEDIKKVDRQGL